MQFDLYGTKPKIKGKIPIDWFSPEVKKFLKNNGGYYLSASRFGWSGIWDIVCNFCYPDILSDEELHTGYPNYAETLSIEEIEARFENEQWTIKGETAIAMADLLEDSMHNGKLNDYIGKENDHIKQIFGGCCPICNGAGVRKNKAVGCIYVMEDGSIVKEHVIDKNLPKEAMIECNSCHGTGDVEPYVLPYCCSIDHVRRFIRFCKNSGGFTVSRS